MLLRELAYRYEFFKEGDESVEYDPEFQLIRPVSELVLRGEEANELA